MLEKEKMFEAVYEGHQEGGQNRGVLNFDYKKADGTVENRTVFVVNESDDYYRGLDFKYLNDDEKFRVHALLSSTKVTTVEFKKADQSKPIEGFESCWKKAWRTYKKSGVVGEVKVVDAPSNPREGIKQDVIKSVKDVLDKYPTMSKDDLKALFAAAVDEALAD